MAPRRICDKLSDPGASQALTARVCVCVSVSVSVSVSRIVTSSSP